jgi:cytosine/adenosine deaminase-related metal-dependent hydrolase
VTGPLLLTGVRPLGGPARDLLVAGGRIAQVGEGLAALEGAAVVDGQGQLALPGLVDAHAHLDKTLWGLPWRPLTLVPAATVGEAVVAHPPRSLVLKRGRVVAGP